MRWVEVSRSYMEWRWGARREEEGAPRVRARGRGTGMLTLRPAEAAWEGMPEMPPPMGLWLVEAEVAGGTIEGATAGGSDGGVTVVTGSVGVEEVVVDSGVVVDLGDG